MKSSVRDCYSCFKLMTQANLQVGFFTFALLNMLHLYDSIDI